MNLQEFKDSISTDPDFLEWIQDNQVIAHTGNLQERLLLYLKKINNDTPPRAEVVHLQLFILSGQVYLR